MGGYSTERMFLQLLTPITLLLLFISSSSGEAVNSSVCVSKGGRSGSYELEGKLPEAAGLEFRDLNLCSMFHEKTCCSASRMLSASLALQNLATHGEASEYCLYFFELLECSICHPDAGVQSGPLRMCASFCDRVFEACSDAYFSSDLSHQVIVPCVARNQVSKWGTNGTAFCEAVGFACYGSKSSFGPVVTGNVGWFQDVKKLVREMTLVQHY